ALTMALPSAVSRLAGMVLFGKHPVRTAALVMTPLVIVGAVQALAGCLGSRRTPSSAVPTIPSGPASRNEKSPFRSARVGMLRDEEALKRRMYLNSLPPKKKSLSLIIGPPRAKPKSLKRSVGFATPLALLMKVLASSLSLRKNSNALPWNLFSPLRVTMLIEAPALRPYSAEKLEVLMLTSRMKSMPMLLTWLLLLPESRL